MMPSSLPKENWRPRNCFSGISFKTCPAWIALQVYRPLRAHFGGYWYTGIYIH